MALDEGAEYISVRAREHRAIKLVNEGLRAENRAMREKLAKTRRKLRNVRKAQRQLQRAYTEMLRINDIRVGMARERREAVRNLTVNINDLNGRII